MKGSNEFGKPGGRVEGLDQGFLLGYLLGGIYRLTGTEK